MSARPFVVVVPVKPPALGKSRLRGLPDEVRRDLAAAFARDTVAAALATPQVRAVLGVTDDHRFASELAAQGCEVVPDGVSGDLNGTLRQAAAEVARRWPGATAVALCADLPALLPADLEEVLTAVHAARPSFVRDAAGEGTTLYAAPAEAFDPRFGPGSAQAHLQSGAAEIDLPVPTLRLDVDDVADLGRALLLGVGPRTAEVTARG